MARSVGDLVKAVLGDDPPVAVVAYDGSTLGPSAAPAVLHIKSPDALRRIVSAPGELGFARAYVAGDLDVEGDIDAVLDLRERLPEVRLRPGELLSAIQLVGLSGLSRLAPPPEEARLRGRRHSKDRDRAAIAHHYDVSNRFYELLLGTSLVYSCAVWSDADRTLEEAQAAKLDLVCRKLGLRPGMRLLDIGCGWGTMVMHAVEHYGVTAVGVTISHQQAELAAKRIADAGLTQRAAVRFQDYRDVDDGPFDAISSIGMFEHVGLAKLDEYFAATCRLLRAGGRLLNHGISRPPGENARFERSGFINRYVFPDGELHEVGSVVSSVQRAGLEVRHVENLREHYALTLRRWIANLEAGWPEVVDEVGEARARVWRLYLAGSAKNFEANRTQVHQVLAVRTEADGLSGLPLRPSF